jgi:hypothetical protein
VGTASDYALEASLERKEINTRASIYRPGTRITLSGTNTNYTLRMMATYASGRSNNGWAYVISPVNATRKKVILMVHLMMVTSIERQLMINMRLSVFYTPKPEVKFSKYS